MTATERWTRVRDLFYAARELDAARRDALLRRECADDAGLRNEVAALLEADGSDAFLRPPEERELRETLGDATPAAVGAGSRVGPYELVRLIARGGMGEVHLARRADDAFQKDVAIKVLHHALLGPHALRRFRQERQVLAKLDHPGVTRLLDGGTTPEGIPYLVMEHVQGEPIDAWCDERRLPLPRRLELFLAVCAAVQYAHRNLIVHGDLKPGNILVTADGGVKLVDFGIARLLDPEDATGRAATAVRAMTPEYASPEQVRGEPLTTAADVYALGVVLYEMLSGRRPLRLGGRSPYEADRAICETTPVPPSTAVLRSDDGEEVPPPPEIASRRRESPARLRRLLSGDLDTIVLTALRKDPARRYGSVEQLAEDVRRHLLGHPVRARRDTFGYRARKFVSRHRAKVAVGLVVVAALAAAMASVTGSSIRTRRALELAESERNAAVDAKAAAHEVLGFFQQMLASSNPYRQGRRPNVLELIEDAERRIERELAGKPEVEAGVRLAIAKTYASLMTWPPVAAHLQRALPLYREARGEDDLVVAEHLGLLGRALSHMGRPAAVGLQRRALEIRRERAGDDDPLVAESTGNLAFALWSTQHPTPWDEAERHYLDALGRYRRLGLDRTRDAARFTMSLGYMYSFQGRTNEAEAMYRSALSVYDDLPVTEDLYELAALCSYANLLTAQARYDEAASVLERARAIMPSDFHARRRCDVLWNLGKVELAREHADDAERHLREALAIECGILAARRPRTTEALEERSRGLRDGAPLASAIMEALETIDETAPSLLHGMPGRVQDLALLLESRDQRGAAEALLDRYGRADGFR